MNQGRDGDPPYSSEDLFGDLVDEKPVPKPAAPAGAARMTSRIHTGPIKIKVSEPGAIPKPSLGNVDLSAIADVLGEPPTPAAVEPLPDLPELAESQRIASEAEARTDFMQLTSRLPRDAAAGGLDLLSVAEHAIDAATPGGTPLPSAIRPSPGEHPGTQYGPYSLIEKIATGGMAEVFKAKRAGVAGFEKVLAVKRILPHLSFNKEFVEMFIAEAKLVADLQHPHIVQIHDLGKIGASYYIAMEYVDGVDLRTILRKLKERNLRMPLDLAMFVVSKVAAGLDHAHQRKDAGGRPMKIVHRDVSPQNILISYDGDVKLTDFGIAKAATKASTTEKGALRGKLMYMSPEQAWAKPIDNRSDVFALGIVLYEMITDQRPFLGGSDMSLLDKVRKGAVAPASSLNQEIPPRLEKLVMKALEREADNRQHDAGAMHRELEAMLQESEQPVVAKDLARFLRILFDRAERAELLKPAPHFATPDLEVDLAGLDEASPDEPLRIVSDPMPLGRLLKRFGAG